MGLFSNLFKQDEKTNEEYLEFLLTKLEKIKTEKAMLEAGENSQLSDLQAQIQKEKQENEELKKQIVNLQRSEGGDSGLKEEYDRMCSKMIFLQKQIKIEEEKQNEKNQELETLRGQLKEYENGYQDVIKYVSKAKEDADALLISARTDAEKIISDAQKEADRLLAEAKESSFKKTAEIEKELKLYQLKIEKEMREKERRKDEQMALAKYRFQEYVRTFDGLQRQLGEIYNEIGHLLDNMPERLSDVVGSDAGERTLQEEPKISLNEGYAAKESGKENMPGIHRFAGGEL